MIDFDDDDLYADYLSEKRELDYDEGVADEEEVRHDMGFCWSDCSLCQREEDV